MSRRSGSFTRRGFVTTTLAATAALALPKASRAAGSVEAFELEDATIADLGRLLAGGGVTSTDLVRMYAARIEALDHRGPALRAVLELNRDAMSDAAKLDAERKAGEVRGPLHGIPILLKDNIDAAGRMQTTAGSLALAGRIASRDAFIVRRLREAGAILLGKTNLSEWANFRSFQSSSGWSGRGGQTRNPHVLDRTPSGSSSGSAVAVAASYAAAAIGTETDGSIVSPSSCCGIVGIKPTVGLVSRSGIIPIAHSQDTAGPMARCVADAAAVLTALTGVDAADEATAASGPHAGTDYTKFLDARGLAGKRIGVSRSKRYGLGPKPEKVLDEAVAAMKAAGAVVIDPVEIAGMGEWSSAEMEVLLYEFKADLNAYLSHLPADAPVRSLADLIRFNEEHAAREMPYFGQDILVMAEEKGDLTSKEYLEALEKCRELTRTKGLDATFAEQRLDAVVSITTGPATPIDLVNGDSWSGGSSSAAAVSGYPSITVPAGFIQGLPVGLSFTGLPWSEGKLIALACGFEQATKARRKPAFARTVSE